MTSEDPVQNRTLSRIEDLQYNVIAGILSAHADQAKAVERMQHILDNLQEKHFNGKLLRCWQIVAYYFDRLAVIPPHVSFKEIINSSTSLSLTDRVELGELFDAFFTTEISDPLFAISVARLAERVRDFEYSRILSDGLAILNGERGAPDSPLAAYDESRMHVEERLGELDLDVAPTITLEGDINDEVLEVLQDYIDIKTNDETGILSGFEDLDSTVGGLFPGSVMLVAGYTSEGKSMIAKNMAYHAAYEMNKNVLFGAVEETRAQVRRTMVVRHSHNERFNGMDPLRYNALKWGRLSLEAEEMLQLVLNDMRTVHDDDGNRRHGRMDIFQLPSHSSIQYVERYIRRKQQTYPVDLVVIDYLGLLASARRQTKREEQDDMLIQTKRMANELQIPVLSPWQISRTAWTEAKQTGSYTKSSLSDTSQAEKTSDVILSILALDEPNTLQCQILKNRDGSAGGDFRLSTDFATCLISAESRMTDMLLGG